MPDTGSLFKSSSPLSPLASTQSVDISTTNAALTSANLGQVNRVKAGTRPYARMTLPSFAGVTMGSKQSELAFTFGTKVPLVGIFNAGTEGTDATLEAVVTGDNPVLHLKAFAASATGSIEKNGTGLIRALFPLSPVAGTKDLGTSTALGTQGPGYGPQLVALTSTLCLFTYVDSANDVFAFPISFNADGSFRGVAASITTIRSNANALQYPTVIRLSNTKAIIMWQDATATEKLEFICCTLTDGATPSMTVGAVADDTAVTAADRVRSQAGVTPQCHITPDANSDVNLAFWVNGPMRTTAGSKAYRLSVSGSTITLNANFTYSTYSNQCFQGGLSCTTDTLVVPVMAAAGQPAFRLLTYAAGNITTTFTSASLYPGFEFNAVNTLIQAYDAVNGTLIVRHSSVASGSISLVKYDPTTGVVGESKTVPRAAYSSLYSPTPADNVNGILHVEGELISVYSHALYKFSSLDLLSTQLPGVANESYSANVLDWRFFNIYGDPQESSLNFFAIHPATRRVFFVAVPSSVISGNFIAQFRAYAWPRR